MTKYTAFQNHIRTGRPGLMQAVSSGTSAARNLTFTRASGQEAQSTRVPLLRARSHDTTLRPGNEWVPGQVWHSRTTSLPTKTSGIKQMQMPLNRPHQFSTGILDFEHILRSSFDPKHDNFPTFAKGATIQRSSDDTHTGRRTGYE